MTENLRYIRFGSHISMSVCNFLRPRTFLSFFLYQRFHFWLYKVFMGFFLHNISCFHLPFIQIVCEFPTKKRLLLFGICAVFFYYFSLKWIDSELSQFEFDGHWIFFYRNLFCCKSLQKYWVLRNEETLGINRLNSNWYSTKEPN